MAIEEVVKQYQRAMSVCTQQQVKTYGLAVRSAVRGFDMAVFDQQIKIEANALRSYRRARSRYVREALTLIEERAEEVRMNIQPTQP